MALDIRQPERGQAMDAMGSIRELMFEAKTTGRMDEVLGGMAEARALELPDMQQGPPGRTFSSRCSVP